jgi:antitoxin (DNA-binding transcriptional repressor) of toxin-antitoxin stability system
LQQARQGVVFVVTSRDEVVAEIRPPSPAVTHVRQPGGLKGRTCIAPDFDEWPEDILAAMEGKEPRGGAP